MCFSKFFQFKFVKKFRKYVLKFVFKGKNSENMFRILKPGIKKEIGGKKRCGGGGGGGGREFSI
jgi:hypothetical protein